ncbi:MAG: hypothetical protein K2G83_06350 [Ruminococcus sp.]|nr:hypothetical protein [Ruminococcus sp.]
MLPFLLIPLAVGAGAGGMGMVFKGVDDFVGAKELCKIAENLDENIQKHFKETSENTQLRLEQLGKTELKIIASFRQFTEAFEKIKNKPEFILHESDNKIPEFNFEEIKQVSVAGHALLGVVGGVTAGGIFGAIASAGTTSAVMALGTASSGTAIASLSGAAATNAALAALGGGAIAAGGGGMVLGTFVLNSLTLGAGMLFGGVAFAVIGNKAMKKANEVMNSVQEVEKEVNDNISILEDISITSMKLRNHLLVLKNKFYIPNVLKLQNLVHHNCDWNTYNDAEKLIVENNILIVSILKKLADSSLYRVTETDRNGNVTNIEPNVDEVNKSIDETSENIKNMRRNHQL